MTALAMLTLCGGMSSCKSHKKAVETTVPTYGAGEGGQTGWGAADTTPKLDKTRQALVNEARRWLGTPYKYGGNDSDGLDCSGLTVNVYKNVMNLAIPRNSARQAEYCQGVTRDNVKAGDLLFFSMSRSRSGINHVGIYIGEGKMIHSSSSRGVVVSGLDDGYYTSRFVMAGRVPALADGSESQPVTPLESGGFKYSPVDNNESTPIEVQELPKSSYTPAKEPTVDAPEPSPEVKVVDAPVIVMPSKSEPRPAERRKKLKEKEAEPSNDPAETVKNAFRKK